MTVIEAQGLTKKWGDFAAVDDLDLAVGEGECYAFLGRNGAGKSTTARMFLDFLRPTSGSVKVLGGSGADPEVRSRIGYLPGDLNLPPTMTGIEAVHYFGSIGHEPDTAKVQALMDRLGLTADRPFHQLSTGSRRKVGLVLAFMNDPDLLILDEPTSGLDPVLQDTFRDMVIEHKQRGATVWLTSHVMSDVDRVADRVGLIDQGKLAQQLSMDELRTKSTGNITLTFPDAPDVSSFDGVEGVSNVQVADRQLSIHVDGPVTAVLARAAELGAVDIQTEKNDLEDIFLDTYSHEAGR
ncbi:ABC transporter ATP-binding protein [Ilumatobacter nonamiensis]|uniref:ABC transporter ATP-binding protein n=1 Tax=Ilumatobacter nonamiensis TaxID=467093 RepID=UPI00034A1640|nr:ABC transporter ATP-binding protein [Ilumatobacter nonamiensis]